MKEVTFEDLGLIDYKTAWDYQENLSQQIISQKLEARSSNSNVKSPTSNYLIICEHPPVITLGKSGSKQHLLMSESWLRQRGIDFFHVNRGGDITFHGPHQIVGYPILNLDMFFTDIHKYLRTLEEIIIGTLDEYGIKGGRIPGATGVWIDAGNPSGARKICAMGIRCSHWVTMHGFALNVNTDLSYFDYIVPCGFNDKKVTSMEKELGTKVALNDVKKGLKKHFEQLFGVQLVTKTPESALK
ncbi:MAG TPA: lipoyl(octanoyl) transferase LipB [Chitinophagales bacterium]|nr:lipoyl(octanoyl) transferase LipB [Chitinophagales bacterium]